MTERVPWFPALHEYIEGVGYEVIPLADGSRSAVPMDTVKPLAELERAEKMAYALERVLVEELNGRLCARPESHKDRCCPMCRDTWRLVDEALTRPENSQNLSTPASRGVEGGDADVTQQDALDERAEARALLFGDALRAISTSGGNGHWLNVYRERGGGYEGLQAIAEHALARDRLIRDAESQEPSS